jgi:hypothetical protein
MKRRICLAAVAALAAALAVLFLGSQAASATQTQVFRFLGDSAFADFTNTTGCIETNVSIGASNQNVVNA